LVALGAGAIVFALAVWGRQREPGLDVRQALVAAYEADAPIAARLYGFTYLPLRPDDGQSTDTEISPASRIATELGGVGRARLRRTGKPSELNARGLLELLSVSSGTERPEHAAALDRAVAALRSAVEGDPSDPVAWTDLAAALLDRADGRREVEDLVDSLEAAQQAILLESERPETRYNLALALDGLYLWHEAREAYSDYLALDSGSDWARLVRARLGELEAGDADSEQIRLSLVGALRAADELQIDALIESYPALVQEWALEELLPEWGRLTLSGSPQAETLRRQAEAIGTALTSSNGDRLLLDSVSKATNAAAARGFAAWGRAAPLVRNRAYEQAEPHLRETRRLLLPLEVPVGLLAEYYLAVAEYQRDRHELAYDSLEALAEHDHMERYPSLLRMVQRMLGGIHHLWGNLESARAFFEDALARASVCRDPSAMANDRLPLAVVTSALGDPERARSLWWQAVQERPRVHRSDYRYLLFSVSADLLSRTGRLIAAERFQAEAVAIAEESGDPAVISDAYLQLLYISGGLHREAELARDFEAAGRAVARIPSDSVRSFREMELLRLQARLYASENLPEAEAALDKVLSRVKEMEYWRILPTVLDARAALIDSSGRRSGELQAFLREAVAEVEQHVVDTADIRERFATLGSAEVLYERLAGELWRAGDYGAAWAAYDRPRSVERWLLSHADDLTEQSTAPEDRVADQTVAAFAILGEDVVAWLFTGGETLGVLLPESADDLTELVSRIEEAVGRGAASDLETILRRLYAALIAPVEPILEGVDRVTIIPYGELVKVPFSSLQDGAGRYFFESVEVSLMPALPSRPETGPRRARSEQLRVLAVGGVQFSRRRFPDLQDLPGSEKEAERVFAVYGGESMLLLGAQATTAAILPRLPRYPVSHLAVHVGRDPENSVLDAIILAESVDVEGDYGIHSMDLLNLDLTRVELIVLSACGSSAKSFEPGRGGDPGLVPSILAAGAGNVLASAWAAEDLEAEGLMIAVHRKLAQGEHPAAAVRAAKLELLAELSTSRTVPVSWLLFELFGQGR
jgi:CHAT domain-containing protein